MKKSLLVAVSVLILGGLIALADVSIEIMPNEAV